jgi:hypothetical protein
VCVGEATVCALEAGSAATGRATRRSDRSGSSSSAATPIARASAAGFSGACAPARQRCPGRSSRETETAGVDITK